jgi:hypothetical protein
VGSDQQAQQKRGAGAHDDEPPDGSALTATEQLLHLRAGHKHQQEKAEPIDERQNVARVPGGVKEMVHEGQPAKQRRPQHDAGQDLADHLGLTKSDEQIAQQLRQADEQQQ